MSHWNVTLVRIAGLCLAVLAFFWVRQEGLREAQLEFSRTSQVEVMALERSLALGLARLQSLALLSGHSQDLNPESFALMTDPWLSEPGSPFPAWMWIPQVSSTSIQAFQDQSRQRVSPNFEIRDLPPALGTRSGASDSFLPIQLVAPAESGQALYGLDLNSSGDIAARTQASARDGSLQLLPAIPPDSGGQLVLAPVYRPPNSKELAGYVACRLDSDRLLQTARVAGLSGVKLTLLGPSNEQLATDTSVAVDPRLAPLVSPLAVAGLHFSVSTAASHEFLDAYNWQPWALAGTVILLAVLLSGFLQVAESRNALRLVQLEGQLEGASTRTSQMEKALQKTEARLLELFRNSQALLYAHDLEGVILQINPAGAHSLGYEPEEMLGKNLRDFMLPTERADFTEYQESLQGGQSKVQGLLRLYARNGSTRIWMHNTSLREGEVHGHALDVTEAKRAERELDRLSRQMEMILNSVGEGIFGVNLAGECSFVNPAACKLTGYSADYLQVAEHPIHELLMSRKADGTAYPWEDSPLQATLQDQKVRRVTGDVFWRKDGSSFPVEYVCTPILERDRVMGAVVNFQDITERIAVEQMKDEFVSVVSHELRTPLTSIRGSLGLLASGILTKAPEKAEAMLKIAVTNTDRLVRLINDILDIERLKSGKISLELRRCDLGELMEQAGEVMEAMATQNQVKLDVAPANVAIHADSDRILQVLTNLLSNAIKFSKPGGTVWLVTELGPPDSEGQPTSIKVMVKDQGRGIPKDKLEAVFERFQQVEKGDSRQKGGTGLGLPICQAIVEQHGGRIWVESVMGEGSTFQFVLPLAARQGDLVRSGVSEGQA